MQKLILSFIFLAVINTTVSAAPASSLTCTDGSQASGAHYQTCLPNSWNGDLLVYAHGYVAATEPLALPQEAEALSLAVGFLGYAFATTSYSTNGLAVKQGLADVVDLVDIFTTENGAPNNVYLVGFSEGGLITTLAVEQYPDTFDGGLAACGPIGDFGDQTNYLGDFRILFDYFFPGLMPDSPIVIPQSLIDDWQNHYDSTIQPIIEAPQNDNLMTQLFDVTGAAYDTAVSTTRYTTTANLLWYNVFATNDGTTKLGGQPFHNQTRTYTGSNNDTDLNQNIARFSASPAALAEINAHYQTSGQLTVPLITLHTTADDIVPNWHAHRYRGKVLLADNAALHEHTDVERYGHCNFTQTEIFEAFGRLVELVENPPPPQPVTRLFLPLALKN